MLFCHVLNFSKSTFLKYTFRYTIKGSNSLDPDQANIFVGPDLGPYCLQMSSGDDASRQRVHFLQQFSGEDCFIHK